MLSTLEDSRRTESRSARLGRLLARRRAFIFAPLFLVALGLAFTQPPSVRREVAILGAVLLVASWLLRVWATGYRAWVHTSGVGRYLMSAGPYAHVRHPLYVANGVAGAAALVVLGRFELLAVYAVAYLAVTTFIVWREEEALATRFGDEHAAYRARVPAFCPVPGRSVPHERREGRFSWEPVRRSFELWKLFVIVLLAAWFLART